MGISAQAQAAILAAANELAQKVAAVLARETVPSIARQLHQAVDQLTAARSPRSTPARRTRPTPRRSPGRPRRDAAALLDRLVVLLHASRGSVTPREVSAKLGLSKISRIRLLQEAIAQGRVRREGNRASTRYLLP